MLGFSRATYTPPPPARTICHEDGKLKRNHFFIFHIAQRVLTYPRFRSVADFAKGASFVSACL